MLPITLHQPKTLAFGAGALDTFVQHFAASGLRRLAVVTAPPVAPLIEPALAQLRLQGVVVRVVAGIVREPTVSDFRAALAEAKAAQADSVAGIGGGSVLDVAKMVAALLHNDQPIAELFGIGKLGQRSAYLACLPTTAGTGSEVSPNAILIDETDGMKKGIVSPQLVPDAAYVDPNLTLGLPPRATAETGMDALCHCIEAYTNRFAHPLVDTYALRGAQLIGDNLLAAVRDGRNAEARAALALGSLCGGLCLGPVNTAAVHALSYPLGSEFHLSHGLVNAMLLPHVFVFNMSADYARHACLAEVLGADASGSSEAKSQQGALLLQQLAQQCGIPQTLTELGVSSVDVGKLAAEAMTVQRLLKNNPRELAPEDAMAIYRKLL
jgi:alcohol dehydrogenase class IV